MPSRVDDEQRVEPDSRYEGLARGLWFWAGTLTVWTLVLTVFLILLVGSIQNQRADGYRLSCEDQNRRHDEAVARLDLLVGDLPPAQRAQARVSRDGTVTLIDALAPKQNCAALVRERVR